MYATRYNWYHEAIAYKHVLLTLYQFYQFRIKHLTYSNFTCFPRYLRVRLTYVQVPPCNKAIRNSYTFPSTLLT